VFAFCGAYTWVGTVYKFLLSFFGNVFMSRKDRNYDIMIGTIVSPFIELILVV